ncbi:hypothetical protein [Cobetia sp. QF-1]|uniref:hypothetical protein n=1 Tax=Cobetia sp. QF-1 TaxID=1969833 RepID=UPI000B53E5B2|nr:hypothetical protein [Cobetia sp. QF-1]
MEEKLKRLKQFNSKSKQSSQRKECKWCKKEILKEASICPSCQQPQSKAHRYLDKRVPIGIAMISVLLSGYSLYVSYNPPPAEPKIGASTRVSGVDKFQLLIYNYGNAPTLLSWIRLKVSLLDENNVRRTAYAAQMLEDPIVLQVGSSPELLTVEYERFSPYIGFSGNEHAITTRSLSKLTPYSIFDYQANDIECELLLQHTSVTSPHLTETPISLNYQNCSYAMRWLASTKGVAIGEAVQETSENRSPDT